MNREIKFRGKRLDSGEWLFGDLLQVANEVFISPSDGDWFDFISRIKNNVFNLPAAKYAVMPETVGQYTGLHDRTGKEVYEGDVVFWIAIDMQGRGKGEQGAIIWDKHTMAWAIMRDKPTSDGRPCIISRPFDRKHLEVVGNIHDNPELLEL